MEYSWDKYYIYNISLYNGAITTIIIYIYSNQECDSRASVWKLGKNHQAIVKEWAVTYDQPLYYDILWLMMFNNG